MKPLALICAAVTGFSPAGLQPVAGPSFEAPDVRLNVPWYSVGPFDPPSYWKESNVSPNAPGVETNDAIRWEGSNVLLNLPWYSSGTNALFSVPIDKSATTNSVFTTDELIVNLESLDPKVFPANQKFYAIKAGKSFGWKVLNKPGGGTLVVMYPGEFPGGFDGAKRALEKRFLETGSLPPIPGDKDPFTEPVVAYSPDIVQAAAGSSENGWWAVETRTWSTGFRAFQGPAAPWPSGVPVDGNRVTTDVMETRNCDCCGSPRQVPVRRTWVRVHGHWLEVKQ